MGGADGDKTKRRSVFNSWENKKKDGRTGK